MQTKIGKLPLHYALENRSSFSSVSTILEAYPNAISEVNERKTPLHCACEGRVSFETVKLILQAYPEGMSSFRS